MAAGLKLPVAANALGRAEIIEGEKQLQKIISLNFMDLSSRNPFQQWRGLARGEPGVDPEIIFAINDEVLQTFARLGIQSLFRRLSNTGRARLAPDYPKFEAPEGEGELHVDIKYINLETQKESELRLPLSRVPGSAVRRV